MKNLIFVLSICFLITSNLFAQQSFTAKVVGVVDGDTITVHANDRQMVIRFAGIDAPEIEQDFGSIAKEQLAGIILNQTVTIADLKNDCLQRLSGIVSLKNKSLNFLLIEAGNAWADNSCQSNEIFSKAELSAKEKKIGLWQYPNPIRPDEFLTAKQNAKKDQATQAKGRKIFTGLAPTPPPILTPAGKPSGIYIDITVDDFISICGDKGDKSDVSTSSGGYQSYSLRFPDTQENKSKGCHGYFSFTKSNFSSPFKLTYYSQQ